MSIPDYQSLMLPVLMASSKDEVRIGQVVDELSNQLGLSPEERSELLRSGHQTVFSKPHGDRATSAVIQLYGKQ